MNAKINRDKRIAIYALPVGTHYAVTVVQGNNEPIKLRINKDSLLAALDTMLTSAAAK